MNRIILIGNGFDLAHGLKTSYRDFIDDFWERQIEVIRREIKDKSGLLNTVDGDIVNNDYFHIQCTSYLFSDVKALDEVHSYASLGKWMQGQQNVKMKIVFTNSFLERISEHMGLENWVDIEEEYFKALKDCFKKKEGIEQLNRDFEFVRQALIDYLFTTTGAVKPVRIYSKIRAVIDFDLDFNYRYLREIAKANYERDFNDKRRIDYEVHNLRNKKDNFPKHLLFLSLNYTDTEKLYNEEDKDDKIHVHTIHLHGNMNDQDKNPVIFGFGDENCKDYKEIEDLNNNDYLEYFKTTMYSNTSNYRDFLNFIDEDKYQVFIMGASCGASDKTLLKTMFEHENCVSIKCFYHKKDDGTDNYSDIIKNISRCFSDKAMMRAKVVNKELSKPLKDI
jgi:hypothetical protein